MHLFYHPPDAPKSRGFDTKDERTEGIFTEEAGYSSSKTEVPGL